MQDMNAVAARSLASVLLPAVYRPASGMRQPINQLDLRPLGIQGLGGNSSVERILTPKAFGVHNIKKDYVGISLPYIALLQVASVGTVFVQ